MTSLLNAEAAGVADLIGLIADTSATGLAVLFVGSVSVEANTFSTVFLRCSSSLVLEGTVS